MSTITIDDKYALSDSDDAADAARPRCLNCDASFAELKKCSRCRAVYFCNAACQRAAWPAHSASCVADPNASVKPQVPEPPRLPTAAEKEDAKTKEKARVVEVTLPAARAASANRAVTEDIIDALEDAIVFAIGEEDTELADDVRYELARAYLMVQRVDECAHYLAPLLAEARREGGEAHAKTHMLAARVKCAKGEADDARKELTAALDCASESTSDAKQCDTLLDAGLTLHELGDWDKCAPILSTAADAAEKLGRVVDAAHALNRAGSALLRAGRPDYAARCWTRELKMLEGEAATTPGALAQAHGNVASAFLLAGADDSAFELHKSSALAKAKEAGPEDEARVMLQLGNAYKLAGDAKEGSLETAKDYFERAKSISESDAVIVTATRALELMNM